MTSGLAAPKSLDGAAGTVQRLLAIHYYFPPLGGIGSIRALKFARYLPAYGWAPTVVAPRDGFFHHDHSLDTAGIITESTYSLELSRGGRRGLMGRAASDVRPSRPKGPFAWFQRLARRHLYRPDAQVGWYPFAVSAARRLLREQRFGAVFSSSFPITAHLVARRLHSEFGLPWVAEFRDPWTDLASYSSRSQREADERLEANILAEADAVVTVSEGFAALLAGRGARCVHVIPNGFDPEDYPADEVAENVVAYLGTYYPGRQDLDTAFRALAATGGPGAPGSLRLRFIGEYGPELEESAQRTGVQGRIEVTGFLPHKAALRALSRARMLLLAGPRDPGADDPITRGWIPAKAFEYLGARRPILYVGNVHSEVADLVRQSGTGEVVAPGDHVAATAAVHRLLAVPRPGLSETSKLFTRRALAGRLAGVLNQAASMAGTDGVGLRPGRVAS